MLGEQADVVGVVNASHIVNESANSFSNVEIIQKAISNLSDYSLIIVAGDVPSVHGSTEASCQLHVLCSVAMRR